MNQHRDLVERIIIFWFGPRDDPGFGTARDAWFRADPNFDAMVRHEFLGAFELAAAGQLDDLMKDAEGCLALVLMLDQFSRNMFRGTPRAFATDTKARAVARQALARGFDQALPPTLRQFLYFPFEHSEDLADQERSVALFEALGNDSVLDYAVRHREIIVQFGRFPHRNKILGRTSTEEELEFLEQPGSSF